MYHYVHFPFCIKADLQYDAYMMHFDAGRESQSIST